MRGIIMRGPVVIEKFSTANQDEYGHSTLTYTTVKSYHARIEPIRESVTLNEPGYQKTATHKMYSISEPTLKNYIELENQRYLIQEVNPIYRGNSQVDHYEAVLQWQQALK
jgi:hypothetical protein